MNLFRLIPFLLAVVMGVAVVASAQEAPADPVPGLPEPVELDPVAGQPAPTVPPAPLPEPDADPDPAATPVEPRDLSLPVPAAGGAAAAVPLDPSLVPNLNVPVPSAKPAKPGPPAGLKKQARASTGAAAGSGEAVAVTLRVGGDGPRETFLISLRPDLAPQTVAAFKRNIESGFYEGLAFHRLIRNYLIQTGDPLSKDDSQKEQWGTSDIGQNIPGEFGGSHVRYAVAMAHKAGETTSSGSQFFITLRPATSLDGSYAVFGEVTQGMEVLDRLSGAVVDTNDTPVKRIEIVDAKLVRADTQLEKSTTLGGRRKTRADSQKGRLEKFIERVW